MRETMYLYHVLIINIRHKMQTVCFYLYWHTNDKENLRKRQKQKMRQNISFCQIHYFVVLKVTRRRDLPLASIDITITLRFLRMNISIYRIKNKADCYELYTNYQSIWKWNNEIRYSFYILFIKFFLHNT